MAGDVTPPSRCVDKSQFFFRDRSLVKLMTSFVKWLTWPSTTVSCQANTIVPAGCPAVKPINYFSMRQLWQLLLSKTQLLQFLTHRWGKDNGNTTQRHVCLFSSNSHHAPRTCRNEQQALDWVKRQTPADGRSLEPEVDVPDRSHVGCMSHCGSRKMLSIVSQ